MATVSRVLHGNPSVNPAMRQRVLASARRLDYHINPYVGSLMSALRLKQGAAFKGNLALIWMDRSPKVSSDKRLWKIRQGALSRAQALGYTLAEFDLEEFNPEALQKVLTSRGIRGVMFAALASVPSRTKLGFDLGAFACVALGWRLLEHPFHTIRFDYYQAIRLAFAKLEPVFGKGIAALWSFSTDQRAHHTARASFLANHPGGSWLARQLFWDSSQISSREGQALIRKHAIGAVIAEAEVEIPGWMTDQIPPENIVWLKNPEPRATLGWIDTRNDLMAAWGVDQLSALLHQNETGVPEVPKVLLVPPRWVPGAGADIAVSSPR